MMLLSEFVYLLRFFCELRCELIPHILVCELLPRPTLLKYQMLRNATISELSQSTTANEP